MTWLPLRQIDAFTRFTGKGNAAGIVTLEEPLTDAQMLAIARELNLSETAFLLPDPVQETDVRIRYFTPRKEIPLCGHATIAALHHIEDTRNDPALPAPWRDGLREPNPHGTTTLSSRVGTLTGNVDEQGIAWTTMGDAQILGPWDGAWGDLLHVLTTDEDAPPIAGNAQPIATADGIVALEIEDVATLGRLRPDMTALAALESQGAQLLVAWARRGRAYGTDWHQRVFAPALGIPEDPVTGLAVARMALILLNAGRLKTPEGEPLAPTGSLRLKARQGDALDRRGIVHVEIDRAADGEVSETRIGGRAVVSLEGRIRVPEDLPFDAAR